MRTSHPLILVFGADDNFAMPLAVSIYSALTNLKTQRTVEVHILDGGISSTNQHRLKSMILRVRPDVVVRWHSPDMAKLADIETRGDDMTRAGYLRMLIPDLLEPSVEKVIYLDSDVVVEGNLSEIWDAEMGDAAALAVLSYSSPVASSPSGVHNYRELNLPPDARNFNSGVLVLNLPVWREEELGRKGMQYLRDYGVIYLADQVALNAVLANRWRALDSRWNQTHDMHNLVRYSDEKLISHGHEPHQLRQVRSALAEAIRDPKIIHFTGSSKPWRQRCYHPQQSRFASYLRASGWLGARDFVTWQGGRQLWRLGRNVRRLARHAGLKRPAFLRHAPGAGHAPAQVS